MILIVSCSFTFPSLQFYVLPYVFTKSAKGGSLLQRSKTAKESSHVLIFWVNFAFSWLCFGEIQTSIWTVWPLTFWKRATDYLDHNPFINNKLTFTTADLIDYVKKPLLMTFTIAVVIAHDILVLTICFLECEKSVNISLHLNICIWKLCFIKNKETNGY